jgi:outer membrane receptor protein involved in Fe transport
MKITTLIILLFFFVNTSAQFTISGIVKEQATKSPLIGANVSIEGTDKGVTTNEEGAFTFSTTQKNLKLTISYVGFQTTTIALELKRDTFLTIFLENTALEEVVITDNRPVIDRIGNSEMTIERINLTPSILGEIDPLKSLVFQSGVSGGAEGTSAIHVRGGNADQNLMLLDGTRVYNQGHLLGLLSVFNPSTVERVNIIKGGFPANYGGRLSSVIEVQTKSGEKDENELSIGTISSRFFFQKKVNEKLSIMAGVRLGNLAIYSLPLQFSTEHRDERTGYWMYDTNFRLNYKITPNDFLTFSAYHGRDYFYQSERDGTGTRGIYFDDKSNQLSWGNNVSSLKYTHLKAAHTSSIQLAYSSYGLSWKQEELGFDNATFSNFSERKIRNKSLLQDVSLLAKHEYQTEKWLHIIGGEGILHSFKPSDASLEKLGEPFPLPFETQTYQTLETALFYQTIYNPTERLRLEGGLRFSMNQGIDKIFYNAEPRLSVTYKTSENSALKINYSKMIQPMHLLSTSASGFPTDVWIPISEQFAPQIAHQIDGGFQIEIPKAFNEIPLNMGFEVFYKKMDNLVNYTNNLPLLLSVSQRWDLLLANNGQGQAYGVELSASKEKGRFKAWMAYTLQWSYRQFDELNKGNWFAHLYDRRHDFSLTSTYNLSKKWEVSTNFVFATGLPYTSNNTTIVDLDGYPIVFATEKHGERLPNYHRLDIVFNYKKIGKRGRPVQWSFGIYNTYAQRNIFSLDKSLEPLDIDEEVITFIYDFKGLSFLRAIPFVTYTIKL